VNLTKTALSILLIAAIFFAGYFIRGCSGDGGKVSSVDTVTETTLSYDSSKYTLIPKDTNLTPDREYFRLPTMYIDTGSTDTVVKKVPADVDTGAILADYFQYREYTEDFRDTNVSITANLGVWQNELDTFSLDYKILRPNKSTTKTITKTKTYDYKVWLGGSVNFNRVNASASLDFGRHKIGVQRTMLSDNNLNEGEKWWLDYEVRLFKK